MTKTIATTQRPQRSTSSAQAQVPVLEAEPKAEPKAELEAEAALRAAAPAPEQILGPAPVPVVEVVHPLKIRAVAVVPRTQAPRAQAVAVAVLRTRAPRVVAVVVALRQAQGLRAEEAVEEAVEEEAEVEALRHQA